MTDQATHTVKLTSKELVTIVEALDFYASAVLHGEEDSPPMSAAKIRALYDQLDALVS